MDEFCKMTNYSSVKYYFFDPKCFFNLASVYMCVCSILVITRKSLKDDICRLTYFAVIFMDVDDEILINSIKFLRAVLSPIISELSKSVYVTTRQGIVLSSTLLIVDQIKNDFLSLCNLCYLPIVY